MVATVLLLVVGPGLTFGVAREVPSLSPGGPGGPLSVSETRAVAPTFPTPIQHVVVVMMENQNYSTVLAQGPFEAYLARTYASATNAYGIAHGSIPSYEAAISGVANKTYPQPSGNIGDLADTVGASWAAFEQSMPTPCNRTLNWTVGYDQHHNPLIMFSDIEGNAARCNAHDLTWTSWTNDVSAGTIPNYAFVAPNTTNDDHNSTIAVGDAWLKGWLSPLINDTTIFPHTAFIIAFDENGVHHSPVVNGSSGGQVYTVVVSPYSRRLSSNTFYDTYSLMTTSEWLLGLPAGTLGNDSWSLNPPMQDLFSFVSSSKVTFTETGLPTGTSWSVTLNGISKSSTSSTVSFSEPDGTYAYTVGGVSGFTVSPASGNVTVQGAAVDVTVTYTRPTYSLSFVESGLVAGTGWSVTVDGATASSSSSTIVFAEPNGTHGYTVGAVPGYSPHPPSGSVNVSGGPVQVSVTYTLFTYAVDFNESGLASGTTWSVNLDSASRSSTGSTIAFTVPNGTYAYSIGAVSGYLVTPSSGTLDVTGARVVESIAFTAVAPVDYSVTFTETGLGPGTSWSVTLNTTSQSSTTSSLTFAEPNGTYAYSVGPVGGFTSSPRSGSVTVGGLPVGVTVTFAPISSATYGVSWTESGLPSGTPWSVTLNGTPEGSSTPTISALEPNGTYRFAVVALPGYTAAPRSGTLDVLGGPVEVNITFTPYSYTVSCTEAGLAPGSSWSIALNGVTENSSGSTVVFSEPNGTYTVSSIPPPGFTASGPSSVTVRGAPVAVNLTFTPVMYALEFTAGGLPTGTNWSVSLTGSASTSIQVVPSAVGTLVVTHWSDGTSVVRFSVSDGTYAYLTAAPGYQGASGELRVFGPESAPVAVSFVSGPAPFSLLTPLNEVVIANVALLSAIGAVIALRLRRREPGPPPRAPPTTAAESSPKVQ